jgi:hypothetical protein
LAAAEGLSTVRVRVLRPLEEPIGDLVRHVDLRQSDEEPRVLPAAPYFREMSEVWAIEDETARIEANLEACGSDHFPVVARVHPG